MTSIIIPTKNAGRQIKGLLLALKAQTVQGEIIVIDSSSSDGTVETAKDHGAKTITIKREEFEHGGSRTLAGKEARGDILVYLSQDATPFDEYAVEYLLRPFEDAGIGAAYGRQLPHPGATAFGAHLRLFNYPGGSCIRGLTDKEKYGIKTPFLSNSFDAYRKRALEEIGGFNGRLIMGEDTCAGAKLLLSGYKIAYVAEAMVYHSHNYSVFQEFKRYFDIGVFHEAEKWILKEFGKAEGEGLRYISSEMAFLMRGRKYHLLPEFFIRNGLKYAGYHLGRNYAVLPRGMCKKVSIHSDWWDK